MISENEEKGSINKHLQFRKVTRSMKRVMAENNRPLRVKVAETAIRRRSMEKNLSLARGN